MLWTDRIFISQSDLLRMDAEVAEVAESAGITLDGKNGNIRGAIEETSSELLKKITSFGGYIGTGDVSANHTAAVMNIGIANPARQKAALQQIVVSGETNESFNWLKSWAMHHVLRIFYRGAMNRTTRDRYEDKMRFYASELSRRIEPTLFGLGLPMVLQPLAAPGAFFERSSGTFGSSNVSTAANVAGTLNGVSVNVSVTYVCSSNGGSYISPTRKGNSESAGCVPVVEPLTTGNVLSIDIGSLNPPDGSQPMSQRLACVVVPLAATHWNIYVGLVGQDELYLQNSTPIPITTKTYLFTGDPVFTGHLLDPGQYPDRYMSIVPKRQRG